jgi:hypothetical protein
MAGLRQSPVRIDLPAPDAFGAANGLAGRVDRTKAVGNGQVPGVVRIAWETLSI